jgi:two-component system sensor histidine kinase KdpD
MVNERPGSDRDERPTAEEMLERVRREAGAGARGRLRVYLGMAPGVGKTYAALMELQRRKARGTDCVIGYVETYGRPKTIEAIGDLEVIPRKKCQYKGVTVEEMDTEAIIRRRPAVVLVDELAHTNVPGCSKHEKRWQDVLELLEHGITVISTVNIQHLESLADIVESITGVPVRERVPDWVIDQADEIELVDMTPHALRQRIRHGNVYPRERVEQALRQFFREGNLAALRELALRKMATRAEQDLEQYMRQHGIDAIWPAGERVMVAIDDDPRSQHLIRRAYRRAQRQQSEWLAVFVETPSWARASPEARARLEENLRLAEDLGAECVRVQGKDVAKMLVKIAHEKNIDSIVLGHSRHGMLHRILRGSVTDKLLHLAHDLDLHIVATDRKNVKQAS